MNNVNFIIVQQEVSYPEFIQMLVKQFPTLAEDVLDEFYEDLPHLQVGLLAK